MSRSKMIRIDGEKLAKEIRKRGMKYREVSEEIMRSHDYIADCIRNNEISEISARHLDKRLRIRYEDIAPDEMLTEPEVVEIPGQVCVFTRTDEILLEILKELRKLTGGGDRDSE